MPSAKQRISVTITDTLQQTLDLLWEYYPHLRNSVLESIQFLMIYGAEAIVRDRTGLIHKPNQMNASIEPSKNLSTAQALEMSQDEMINSDDDWA